MLVWCTTSVHTTDLAEPHLHLGPVSGFRLSLYSAEMHELGEFETTVPNWSTGDEFLMGERRRFRIVGIAPFPGADDVPFNAFWKVKPVNE
jgi:hypothetical protein